ncbi:hypothetical protein GUITHDRAFT_153901 [Guillardia theta CCMP2712]|uniref:Uncharacterized protein n=1 Tax=Guillardia theta (strain CCMP2712) TaxID=905079 RepID=L1IZF3_GUITC|nr:hypothetical protein GUITHDRAFT_153901 [Guillardia theta CCMP2712]EKX41264.1 hypothetical protein GUITHDRAFT_153901 [Guillardia theta CCMP2712]|mmetsp:Transcript_8973/g.29924  ORF Transcript_8973/g.29924 Transcript_8973/m.29924 type:complete len:171 (-) Transcript_8973:292-804(-)|eukprot:XP_005828244.1 hypothetical protein GUITHDRAFT_153901 [Guillardia theta CCMP2712]
MKLCYSRLVLIFVLFQVAQQIGGSPLLVEKGLKSARTQHTQSLREDITNPSVKSAFVKKFDKVKSQHKKNSHDEDKKARSEEKLTKKSKNRGDELTASGHKPTAQPEDEAVYFMNMLPWILPVVCLTILVLVGIGAKMCQAGNYKHTAALREGGVQPTFKYGGPIAVGRV